jgi:hypothetical protein
VLLFGKHQHCHILFDFCKKARQQGSLLLVLKRSLISCFSDTYVINKTSVHRPKSPGSRSRAKSGRNPHLHHHHHRPVSFLLASLSRIVALVHQHPANMAAMATAPCFPATPGLPARGAVAARSRMAAGGSRSQRRRSSSGVFLCRSSTTGSSRMEDYNTAMKRMMRNPYEYHHDLGPYQSFFLVYALLMLPR